MDIPVRVVTNEDIKQYMPLVENYLRTRVMKNWSGSQLHNSTMDVSLGNTGMSMNDMRQQLYAEVVVALQKYNPNYKTATGGSVKESTFVYTHLFNRTGQLMTKLTLKRAGYGVSIQNIDCVFDHADVD